MNVNTDMISLHVVGCTTILVNSDMYLPTAGVGRLHMVLCASVCTDIEFIMDIESTYIMYIEL